MHPQSQGGSVVVVVVERLMNVKVLLVELFARSCIRAPFEFEVVVGGCVANVLTLIFFFVVCFIDGEGEFVADEVRLITFLLVSFVEIGVVFVVVIFDGVFVETFLVVFFEKDVGVVLEVEDLVRKNSLYAFNKLSLASIGSEN